ncbi:MAG TPA: hypothetical protein PLZ12_12755 [Saprospiraceae bacterium]|nr:hypothetical protein [Saprospiraceae bacterium]
MNANFSEGREIPRNQQLVASSRSNPKPTFAKAAVDKTLNHKTLNHKTIISPT